MNYNLDKYICLSILLITFSIIYGCGKKGRDVTESEEKLMQLSEEVVKIISQIEVIENDYALKKKEKNWKIFYDKKRKSIDSVTKHLDTVIKKVKFFERMPQENVKNLANKILHACENVKMYLNITNADLSRYYSKAPPSHDPYNWQRYIDPAIGNLKSILGQDISENRRGARHYLHEQDNESVNKQIQSSPQRMEEWKEEVEEVQKSIPQKY